MIQLLLSEGANEPWPSVLVALMARDSSWTMRACFQHQVMSANGVVLSAAVRFVAGRPVLALDEENEWKEAILTAVDDDYNMNWEDHPLYQRSGSNSGLSRRCSDSPALASLEQHRAHCQGARPLPRAERVPWHARP